jgi:hypothetical protein
MRRVLSGIICCSVVTAFFFSRETIGKPARADQWRAVAARMADGVLSADEVSILTKGGTPALEVVLDNFSHSEFVKKAQTSVGKDFNLGAEIDKDLYANNVVRVVEGFGDVGVERLLNTLPTEAVTATHLREKLAGLGAVTVKPLLVANILQGVSPDRESALREYATIYLDHRVTHEVGIPNYFVAFNGHRGLDDAQVWLIGPVHRVSFGSTMTDGDVNYSSDSLSSLNPR